MVSYYLSYFLNNPHMYIKYTFRSRIHVSKPSLKNNLNLGIKTEPVTVGATTTAYVWLLSRYSMQYASAPEISGSVFKHRFKLFLGQCTVYTVQFQCSKNNTLLTYVRTFFNKVMLVSNHTSIYVQVNKMGQCMLE